MDFNEITKFGCNWSYSNLNTWKLSSPPSSKVFYMSSCIIINEKKLLWFYVLILFEEIGTGFSDKITE
jgi:hypothetical protein